MKVRIRMGRALEDRNRLSGFSWLYTPCLAEEHDEDEEDEDTEDSEEDESQEEEMEAPVPPPTPPAYSRIPRPPLWVQRNHGLGERARREREMWE